MILDLDERINLNSIYGINDTLVEVFDIYSDEEDIYGKQIVLQSRCEL